MAAPTTAPAADTQALREAFLSEFMFMSALNPADHSMAEILDVYDAELGDIARWAEHNDVCPDFDAPAQYADALGWLFERGYPITLAL